jgi:hypothetical protein
MFDVDLHSRAKRCMDELYVKTEVFAENLMINTIYF